MNTHSSPSRLYGSSWHADADLEAPNPARIYDYLLGGSHNFAADQQVARAAITAVPDLPQQAAANRGFLRRAVNYLVDRGIRQFLDLGSGIPTVGSVHEIAQQHAPDARVVYVDNDPVAIAHSRRLLAGNPVAVAIEADLRHPHIILHDPTTTAVLDLAEPVAVLLVAVLHFVPDSDDPAGIITQLTDAVCPGSHVVIAHGVSDARPVDAATLTHPLGAHIVPAQPPPRQPHPPPVPGPGPGPPRSGVGATMATRQPAAATATPVRQPRRGRAVAMTGPFLNAAPQRVRLTLPALCRLLALRPPSPTTGCTSREWCDALGHSLSPALPAGCIQARLLLFHTEAADQAHVVYMPDTTWPVRAHPRW